jgi:ribonuclease-3
MAIMKKNLEKLEKKIKIKFKNSELLEQALTHRSYLNEHPGKNLTHNERLEFLGDAVIEFIITEYLYNNYSEAEGILTSWRASLVNTNMLFKIAKEISLDKYIYLSRGESLSFSKKTKVTILADALEALVGAIYLDQGTEKVKEFLTEIMVAKLPHVLKYKLYEDPKSRLQELTQSETKVTPNYRVLKEEGPDHAKNFTVGVFLADLLIARGIGKSKQEASLKAAAEALKKYSKKLKIKKK